MKAINCWNYLHLSQHLVRLLPKQQAVTLATLSPFVVLSYRHLNLHGEYDFSDQPLPPEAPFDMDLNCRLAAAKQTRVGASRRFYPICLTTPYDGVTAFELTEAQATAVAAELHRLNDL